MSLSRGKPLRRTGRIKPKKRSAAEFQRIYGSKERVAWIQAQPSVVSLKCPCENVHVIGGGMARKADYKWIVPLTAEEHRELHQIGKPAFEAKWGVDLGYYALAIEGCWQAFQKLQRSNDDAA